METSPSDTQTAFPPLLRGVILGLIIGLAVGYVIPKSPAKQAGQQAQSQIATTQTPPPSIPTEQTAPVPPPPPPQAPQGLYAKVQKNDKGTLTAQEVLPSKQPSSKIFTIKTSSETAFTYQKPTTDKNAPFKAETGKVGNIKKDMYLFVLTTDNPATASEVTAQQIMYSEKNPF
ncbi:MAG: hypothetical protein AAB400_05470 [Patescibacteria group bacterium]